MKIKNIISLLLVFMLSLTVFAACAPKEEVEKDLLLFSDPKTGEEKTELKDAKGNLLMSQEEMKAAFRVFVQIQRDYAFNQYTQNAQMFMQNGIKSFTEFLSFNFGQGSPREDIENNAEKNLIHYITFKKQFVDLGLTFTEEDNKNIENSYNEIVKVLNANDTSTLSKFCSETGITQETFKDLLVVSRYRVDKVSEHFFGKGGENEITEEMLKEYYDRNYTRLKAITISCLDKSGMPLKEDALKEKQAKAEELFKKANKGANFEELIKSSSEAYLNPADATNDQHKKNIEETNKRLVETGFLYDDVGYDEYFSKSSYFRVSSVVMDKAEKLKKGEIASVEIKEKDQSGKEVITEIWIIKAYDINENEKLYEESKKGIQSNIILPQLKEKTSQWQTALSYHFDDEAELKYLTVEDQKTLLKPEQSQILYILQSSNLY